MSLQSNPYLERNKIIAITVIKGGLLKVVASDHQISMERVRQITYNMIHKFDEVHAGSYREFSNNKIKEIVGQIEGLK